MDQMGETSLVVYTSSMEQESNDSGEENMLSVQGDRFLNALMNKNLVKQISDALKDQMTKFIKELKALESAPQHMLAMVVLEADISKKEGKQRGRKATNELVGPIFVSFELPDFCFHDNIDIEAVLAAEHPEQPRRFSVHDRLKNWKMQYSKRTTGLRDVYYYHLPSNLRLRSKTHVIDYIFYEVVREKPEGKGSKKRKLAMVAVNKVDPISIWSAPSNQMISVRLVEEDEKFGILMLESKVVGCVSDETQDKEIVDNKMEDDFFEGLDAIETRMKNIWSGQMVEYVEKPRDLDFDCKMVGDYFDGLKDLDDTEVKK